ncbi:hypothetical protein F5148DRAFT_1290346 [Russula earlei]|uniref:Uncharacterized protein n=1 Tax=Russula earlei TaxID=71964 RepID=A0ACC0TWJ0_9AGAM|nr:hypothetical protein F5148DRAFT_1290346 [Russula earlei]
MLDLDHPISPPDALICACESATKTCHSNYATTQQSIENKFHAVFGGKPPYSWQVDITEALLLGLDCVVIAGTGSGKTMPFGMPLLDEAKDNMVVVISPLNELEAEKAERFHKLGLTATAVNGDVHNKQLHKIHDNNSSFTHDSCCTGHKGM